MELGKTQFLKALRTTDNGCYLVDAEGNEVLLPNAYVSPKLKLGDEIEVFVYLDNGERITATTLKPKLELEQFAYLEVKQVNNAGAFVDMGLVKQLLIPYREQEQKLEEGDWVVVFMLLDEETNRLIGSTKIKDFLFFEDLNLEEGDEVDLLFYRKTDLGANAIVNNLFQGLVFKTDIHQPLHVGDKLKGFVKKIREDGKIDLVLQPIGYKNLIDAASQTVLDAIKKNNGTLKLSDKSHPDDIKRQLGMSKKAFKKALGFLYKNKLVILEERATKLVGAG
jgi:predicted RNA-binding protein (virulence factor B family)